MKQYKVGILGATGAVGREMMKVLEERKFPISELHLFASARSAGKVVAWNGKPIQIELAAEGAFDGLNFSVRKLFSLILTEERRNAMPRTFYDYVTAKQEGKRNKPNTRLYIGLGFLVLAAAALAVWLSAA